MAGTITESIQRAMRELGVPNDLIQLDGNEAVPTKKQKPVKKDESLKKSLKKKFSKATEEPEESPNEDFMNFPEPAEDNEEQELQVYCKVKDGRMILFFPEGYDFIKTPFGDSILNTLTFNLPDINNKGLQVLNILTEDNSVSKNVFVKRVPIILLKEEENTENEQEDASDEEELNDEDCSDALSGLMKQKAEVDKAIKEARAEGNNEEVNRLRKQRHSLRNAINKSKEE
jgi:hypothetical protein